MNVDNLVSKSFGINKILEFPPMNNPFNPLNSFQSNKRKKYIMNGGNYFSNLFTPPVYQPQPQPVFPYSNVPPIPPNQALPIQPFPPQYIPQYPTQYQRGNFIPPPPPHFYQNGNIPIAIPVNDSSANNQQLFYPRSPQQYGYPYGYQYMNYGMYKDVSLNDLKDLNYNIINLLIELNVKDDAGFINKTINFSPRMISNNLNDINNFNGYNYNPNNSSNILLLTSIPLNIDLLKESLKDEFKKNDSIKIDRELVPSDFIRIFSDKGLINKLLTNIKRKKTIRSISIKKAIENGYVTNNIDLLLSIFFNRTNKISLGNINNFYQTNNNLYQIHSFNWNGKFNEVKDDTFKIEVDLFVMENDKEITDEKIKKFSCNLKKNNIEKDLNELGISTKEELDMGVIGPTINVNRMFNNFRSSLKGGNLNRNKYKHRKTLKHTHKHKDNTKRIIRKK